MSCNLREQIFWVNKLPQFDIVIYSCLFCKLILCLELFLTFMRQIWSVRECMILIITKSILQFTNYLNSFGNSMNIPYVMGFERQHNNTIIPSLFFLTYICNSHDLSKDDRLWSLNSQLITIMSKYNYFIWKTRKERVHNYSWNSNKSDIMSMLLMKWSIHIHRSSSNQKTSPQKGQKITWIIQYFIHWKFSFLDEIPEGENQQNMSIIFLFR